MTDKENFDNWKGYFTIKPDVGYPGKINIDEYDCCNDNKIMELHISGICCVFVRRAQ